MEVSSSEFWIVIGVAILCGGLVGLERQFRSKPVGIRTSILVCLGTSIFIILGRQFTGDNVDATRVLGQVVTGIGFLGAGVIIAREGLITGVTTASVIWVLAGIGAMIGFEYYLEALIIAGVTVSVLTGIELLESRVSRLQERYRPPGDEVRGYDE